MHAKHVDMCQSFFAMTVKKYSYEILGENFSACEIIKTKKSCGHPGFLSDEIF